MKLKADKRLRDMFFVPDAMSHPAKGHCGMWMEIIERYTKPDDWILDPMAGIGTSLLACLMGRNVVCVELEGHFVAPMVKSWEKMKQHGPMLGCNLGQAVITQGDARTLSSDTIVDSVVTSPPYEGSLDHEPGNKSHPIGVDDALHNPRGYTHPDTIITSPPWEDKTALQDSQWLHSHEVELAERFRQVHAGEMGLPGNTKPENRTTMEGYTCPDSIITSSPYGGTDIGRKESLGEAPFGGPNSQARGRAYTRPDAVITSPPYQMPETQGGLNTKPARPGHDDQTGRNPESASQSQRGYTDAVITSLPYGEAQTGGGIAQHGYDGPNHGPTDLVGKRSYMPDNIGGVENIGNLRGDAYWRSMRQVYQNCHDILKPQGIMVLILKGFTRDGKYIDLPEQTKDVVEKLGFKLFDRWQRELWNLSFWRILQKRRSPETFDDRLNYEDILAFRKIG